MTYGLAGSSPFADLSKSEHAMLKDLLFANWSLTGTLVKDPGDGTDKTGTLVKFGLDWVQITNTYEVHCIRLRGNAPMNATTDWKRKTYSVNMQIHVFVRRNGTEEPAELDQIKREIDRIIAVQKSLQGTNMPLTMPLWSPAWDNAAVGQVGYWHLKADLTAFFQKVNA